MKKIAIALLVLNTFLVSSCGYLAVKLTPNEVKNAIAIGAAVSNASVIDPPIGSDLTDYLNANAELWNELFIYFDVEE